MKSIVYVDMDGVLVNLASEIDRQFLNAELPAHLREEPDLIEGLFENPEPITGAVNAVHLLNNSGIYELFIATTAPWNNPGSLVHKRLWIEKHFGNLFYKKMFITHRKDLLIGDYLIDDRMANGAAQFRGQLLHFGVDYVTGKPNTFPNWESVIEKLLHNDKNF